VLCAAIITRAGWAGRFRRFNTLILAVAGHVVPPQAMDVFGFGCPDWPKLSEYVLPFAAAKGKSLCT